MAERMRAQFRGLAKATQNAMDGMSLVQTAESSLREVSEMLQRGRELALQAANGVLDNPQRQQLQNEMDHLLAEIDRIADTATFNNRRLLNSAGNAAQIATTLNGLKTGWLEESANIISTYYGLTGDNSTVSIVLENSGPSASWITGTAGIDGKLENIRLHFNVKSLATSADPDRMVARALAQSMLARNTNYVNLDQWFISGASDLIAGGHEMLYAATNSNSAAAIVNALDSPWANNQLHQASAYLALTYLNSQLAANGATMADVMSFLSQGNDLNTALSFTIGMDSLSFINDFKTNGVAYLNNMISSGVLTGPDVGGIHPGNSAAVIPDSNIFNPNPNVGFNLQWVIPSGDQPEITLQVGANQADTLTFSLPEISTAALDLIGLNLVTSASQALDHFTKAITAVTSARTSLGATSNRLEHIISANQLTAQSEQAGFSRIVDLDMAQQVADLTRNQILVSSSGLIMAQANTRRQNVSWLLNGLPAGRAFAT